MGNSISLSDKKSICLLNNAEFDGIIFDVDGTLWDSTPTVERAWNDALVSFGINDAKVTADILKGLFGLPMDDIIEKILPNESIERRMEFKPLCFDFEHRYIEEFGALVYEGVEEMFEALSKEHKLFIVSNCQAGYIELFLKKTGMGEYISDHLCPGDTNLLKADNIKMIAEKNGLKKPIYIGDTHMDHEACKSAEVPFIFAAYGFGKSDNPDYIIESPLELIGKNF